MCYHNDCFVMKLNEHCQRHKNIKENFETCFFTDKTFSTSYKKEKHIFVKRFHFVKIFFVLRHLEKNVFLTEKNCDQYVKQK